MTKKMKKRTWRIALGGILFIAAIVTEKLGRNLSENLILGIFLVAYFIIGGDVVKRAVKNIGTGQIFDENFLMTIATVGAFLVSEYPEAVAVMLFYQVGELFQDYAVHKSRRSIADLMNIRPDYANLITADGTIQKDPGEIHMGEKILVKPGERVPLDGVIVKGATSLDTSALTGESLPRDAQIGQTVLSGCVNLTGTIEMETTKEYGDSTVAKILELVETAASRKAQSEDCCNQCDNACNYSTTFNRRRLESMDLQSAYLSGNFLSLRTSDFSPIKLFRGSRRSRKKWDFNQRRQLS